MFPRTLIAVFSILILLVTPTAGAGADVVDYYNQLQRQKHLGLDYPLKYKSGRWTTTNRDWNTAIPAIVNIDTGYIFFSDEGTGGGNYDTQIQLYHKADQTPVLAIIENGYNPPYPEDIRVRFFTRVSGRWENDTKWLWPDITLDDFLSAKMTVGDLRALKAINAQVYIKLSKQGTAPIAHLVVNETIARAVCGAQDWIKVANEAPYLHYCQHLRGKIFNKIGTVWDKQHERFNIGKKSRAAALWSDSTNTSSSPPVRADAGFLRKLRALSNDEARSALVIALGKQPSEQTRKTLENIAADTTETGSVRMQAICSLVASASRDSVPVLLRIIEKDIKERRGYWACAIPILGNLGDRSAIPLLKRIANLNQDHLVGMDHMAIEALARLGDEREITLLASKAYIVPVRLAVIEGLARIASVYSSGILIEALQEAEEAEVVDAARRGLRKIGKAAIPALNQALQENRDQKSRSRIKKLISQLQK